MIWKCRTCQTPCTFSRNTVFPPERCVYNDRGKDKVAKWEKL